MAGRGARSGRERSLVVGADQPAEAARGLTAYLAPEAEGRARPSELERGVRRCVLVRADLVPIPDEAA